MIIDISDRTLQKNKKDFELVKDIEKILYEIVDPNSNKYELDFVKRTSLDGLFKIRGFSPYLKDNLFVRIRHEKPVKVYGSITRAKTKSLLNKVYTPDFKKLIKEKDRSLNDYINDEFEGIEYNEGHYSIDNLDDFYRDIKDAYFNRKDSIPTTGEFSFVDGNYYINIYINNIKHDKYFMDRVKAVFMHELFHFNHCLHFEKEGKSWNNAKKAEYNKTKQSLIDMVIEGYAKLFELVYLRDYNNDVYKEEYEYLFTRNMFAYPYSFSIMLLELISDKILLTEAFKKSINSFSESFSIIVKEYKKFNKLSLKPLDLEN